MKALSYIEWLDYFAHKCRLCSGSATVKQNGITKRCPCQVNARKKWRLEQIQIEPPDLKYKDWQDFRGMIGIGDQIEGHLTLESAIGARNKAFSYCFGCSFDKDYLRDHRTRVGKLIIHRHLRDGKNVVIAGEGRSGRTMLSVLILKEVANVSDKIGRDLDYRWVRFYDLVNSARWTTNEFGTNVKAVNHSYLDNVADLDFLFLEGVDVPRGGHTYPPDHVAMNTLFGTRRAFQRPNIIVCSMLVVKLLNTIAGRENVTSKYGAEFVEMLTDSNNVVIELVKENAR